jgi:predicted nucleotidyltransferase
MHRARSASDLARERAERDLNKLIPALLANFPIRRLLAFGSFARRDMHELSDLDLILIGDFEEPRKLRVRAVRELVDDLGLRTEIDVTAYTPAEFEKARDGVFLENALSESIEIELSAARACAPQS